MNTSALKFVCTTLLLVVSIHAADGVSVKSPTVEQRMREVELSATLQHYERMIKDLYESETKLTLLETEASLSKEEYARTAKLLARRIEILRQQLDQFRSSAIKIGSAAVVAKSN